MPKKMIDYEAFGFHMEGDTELAVWNDAGEKPLVDLTATAAHVELRWLHGKGPELRIEAGSFDVDDDDDRPYEPHTYVAVTMSVKDLRLLRAAVTHMIARSLIEQKKESMGLPVDPQCVCEHCQSRA
jgi:hypothetical protein